ncbi:MAG: polysaccharide deacetylase family protein, partial [Ferruginibacter sp.]
VRDVITLESYRDNLLGEQTVIPRLLESFKKYEIHATFSTVGLLFFSSRKEMLENLPSRLPQYVNKRLSPYGSYMHENVGEDFKQDLFHFAPHLLQMIQEAPEQEIGTHTFSHYYCLEMGQSIDDFREDIRMAIKIAAKEGIKITSIVFPRNQFNAAYLGVCKDLGIIAYRNNENSWIYSAKNGEEENLFRRMVRLTDAYLNISGHHCHELQNLEYPVNIPSSRFLRPYSPSLRFLENLRMRRIKRAMTHAAKHRLLFHLWWHPHNFGINQDENFAFLTQILEHYLLLNKLYGFKSITMTNLAKKVLQNGT